MKHIWTIVCRKSTIEEGTNLISLSDSLEQLDVHIKADAPKDLEVVNVPIESEVVSYWFRDDKSKSEKYSVKIEFIDPNGKVLGTYINELLFPENSGRLRSRIKSNNLPVTITGMYFYKVLTKSPTENDFSEVASVPLEVIVNRDVKTASA